jgi:hypothetical protein
MPDAEVLIFTEPHLFIVADIRMPDAWWLIFTEPNLFIVANIRDAGCLVVDFYRTSFIHSR